MRKRTAVLAAVATMLVISLAGASADADICRSNKPGTYDPDNATETWSGVDIDWKLGKFGPSYPPSAVPMAFGGPDWKICIQENPD